MVFRNPGPEGRTVPMYDPVKDGVAKTVEGVVYLEVPPPERLSGLVHCYWELRSEHTLAEDFVLHALPDACVNILLNQLDTAIAGITALQTTYLELNLGTDFHYAGVQLYPGVWQGGPDAVVGHYVGEPYDGDLGLVAISERSALLDFADKTPIFDELVDRLAGDAVIAPNPVTARILASLDDIHSVGDMAAVAALSTRQLQRSLKASTGFSPHDFLKVLRLQQSFRRDYQLAFADQSHYTHAFRKATGYTPGRFQKTFDV